jgi:ParB family chromosome partitioning protein
VLLALPTSEAQLAAYGTVVRKGLSVRQTEELVRQMQGEKPARTPRPPKNAEADHLATQLRERLGTKVTLRRGRRGGTITLHFYSDEELNSIAEAILGE